MEEEMFYLAETWHLSPLEIRHIPYSLRKRMVERKVDLEASRQAKQGSRTKHRR